MNISNFTTIPSGAVVSRPPGSRLDIITTADGNTSGVCQIVSLNPFQWKFPDGTLVHAREAYFLAFADYLAVKHLNEGDGSLVEEVDGLSETCNIKFGLEFVDTEGTDPQLSGRFVLNRIGAVNDAAELTQREFYEFNPCVFMENTPYSASAQASSFVTGLNGYTMISGLVDDEKFEDNIQFPKFARTIPEISGVAKAIVEYAREALQTKYMAILYVDLPSAISIARAIRSVAYLGDTEEEFHLEEVVVERSYTNIEEAVSDLKKLRFNTIVAILPDIHPFRNIEKLLGEALNQGVVGNGDTTWIFDYHSIYAMLGPFTKESVFHKAYRGSGLIFNSDYRGPDHYKFLDELNAFKNKDDGDEFQYFLSKTPGYDPDLVGTIDDFYGYYGNFTSSMRYRYDATVLAGVAACRAVEKNSLFLGGDEFYNTVVRTEFEGTSGFVTLNKNTGSRLVNSTAFTMLNLPDLEETPVGNETFVFQFDPVGKYEYDKWEFNGTFIFNDGTAQPPGEIPLIYENDEFALRTVTVVLASFLCVIPIIFALGCAIWTRLNQKKRIVRASQPFFLYFISAGTILLALSIVPLLFDLTRTNLRGMKIACNAVVWLSFFGISVTLSAFFAKTHRIVKIMKASERCKRVTITVKDAVVPMVIVLTCNLILLTVSTAINPFEYEPIPFGNPDRFGRTLLAYGQCIYYEFSHTIFWVLIGLLNLGLLCRCAYEAYQARTLATEFQESEHIFKALSIAGGVLFIGLPVSALNRDDPDVRLFIYSVMVFAICNIILFVMFVPKIRYKSKGDSRNNINVYVQGTPTVSTSSSTMVGETIVTSKTRQELVLEIATLRQRLAASEPKA